MPYEQPSPSKSALVAVPQDIPLDPLCVSDIEAKSGKSLLFLLAVHEDGDITSFINPTTNTKAITVLPIPTSAITNTQVVSLITYEGSAITGAWRLINGKWLCTSYQAPTV